MITALLTAAGSGSRMGQDIPKQFIHIDNKPLIIHTMEAFQRHPSIDAILVVTLPSWIDVLKAYASQFNITKLRWVVPGGETGQESIRLGLEALENQLSPEDIVMIHDGNRCLVSSEIISNCLATQTPHAYSLGKLLWAHKEAQKRGITGTAATCVLMQKLGETIYFSKGSEENLKITTLDDMMIFKALLHTKKDTWLKE